LAHAVYSYIRCFVYLLSMRQGASVLYYTHVWPYLYWTTCTSVADLNDLYRVGQKSDTSRTISKHADADS